MFGIAVVVPSNRMGALTEYLAESKLFGYVKAAFTGGERERPGRARLLIARDSDGLQVQLMPGAGLGCWASSVDQSPILTALRSALTVEP